MSSNVLVELFFANINDFGQVPLTTSESDKFDAFKSKKRKQEYALSRWLRRKFLSLKTNIPSNELQFYKNKCGKPYLQNQAHFFNISHSHDWVVLAICKSSEIGIDIQKLESKKNMLEIAKQYFSTQEYIQLKTIKDNQQQMTSFYNLWTAKEAVLKALGTGIANGLDVYNFSIKNNTAKPNKSCNNILFSQFKYEDNYSVSLALLTSSSLQLEINRYRVTNINELIKINL
ncbi:4'-phosphopantetheinyl transferase superfamily protein [Francisellaceae bacterium]|nr:4'-phosphopantetheinyl transferase superfamily protein [Francisellaceae bacterium]